MGPCAKEKEFFAAFFIVPADADGSFRYQTLLACLLSAHVIENLVVKREQCIRDDLFMQRIVLGLGARQEEIVSARQNCIEISARGKVQPLKIPEFIEQISPND